MKFRTFFKAIEWQDLSHRDQPNTRCEAFVKGYTIYISRFEDRGGCAFVYKGGDYHESTDRVKAISVVRGDSDSNCVKTLSQLKFDMAKALFDHFVNTNPTLLLEKQKPSVIPDLELSLALPDETIPKWCKATYYTANTLVRKGSITYRATKETICEDPCSLSNSIWEIVSNEQELNPIEASLLDYFNWASKQELLSQILIGTFYSISISIEKVDGRDCRIKIVSKGEEIYSKAYPCNFSIDYLQLLAVKGLIASHSDWLRDSILSGLHSLPSDLVEFYIDTLSNEKLDTFLVSISEAYDSDFISFRVRRLRKFWRLLTRKRKFVFRC